MLPYTPRSLAALRDVRPALTLPGERGEGRGERREGVRRRLWGTRERWVRREQRAEGRKEGERTLPVLQPGGYEEPTGEVMARAGEEWARRCT